MPDIPAPIPGNGPTVNGSPWLIPDIEETDPPTELPEPSPY